MATQTSETPSHSDPSSPPEGAGTRVHKTINRWLATVALVLSIVILAAIIIGGIRLVAAANEIGDRLSEPGSSLACPKPRFRPKASTPSKALRRA